MRRNLVNEPVHFAVKFFFQYEKYLGTQFVNPSITLYLSSNFNFKLKESESERVLIDSCFIVLVFTYEIS